MYVTDIVREEKKEFRCMDKESDKNLSDQVKSSEICCNSFSAAWPLPKSIEANKNSGSL